MECVDGWRYSLLLLFIALLLDIFSDCFCFRFLSVLEREGVCQVSAARARKGAL